MADRFARSGCKPPMPIAHLEDRALVSVSGPDAEHLLQNIVTTDLDGLAAGEARAGRAANAARQDPVRFPGLARRRQRLHSGMPRRHRRRFHAPAVALQAARQGRDFQARIKPLSPSRGGMSQRLQTLIQAVHTEIQALRVPIQAGSATRAFRRAAVFRSYAPPPGDNRTPDAWHAFRIAHGIAESGADYALGDAFPHDVLLDELGGIGFRKGCYVGQEVVSRMQHRGTARRRVLIVTADEHAAGTGHRASLPAAAAGRHARLGRRHDRAGDRCASTGSRRRSMPARRSRRATCRCDSPSRPARSSPFRRKPRQRRRPDGRPRRRSAARLAAHAVGPPARPARPLAARHRDRRHRARACPRRPLERPDQRRPRLLGGAAFAAGRGDLFASWCQDASPEARLTALLHDAPEYVIGDMISPFKSVVGGGYKDCEQRLQRAIHLRFSLPPKPARGLQQGHQARRPDRRLFRGDAARRLLGRRGDASIFGRPRGFDADRFDFTPRSVISAQKCVSQAVFGARDTSPG